MGRGWGWDSASGSSSVCVCVWGGVTALAMGWKWESQLCQRTGHKLKRLAPSDTQSPHGLQFSILSPRLS